MNFETTAQIVKRDDDKQIAYGWASIFEVGGKPVVDRQGDMISAEEIRKTAHSFVQHSRVAKVLHEGDATGTIVESMVLDRDVQKALGIDLGKSGWWIGMHIPNPDIWARVKSGELPAFSIGGRGRRREVTSDAEGVI